ncbi:membrane protein YczE [Pasteurella bettyae]|uniref:YitT family protein n=1 Tax=Pasteurella bettyae CCUG 2042 TaxID=1095749 RepID=I3D679_9PAST|nr:membrane protein [Pasteurella bettyae]EIJ67222.1 hypothetical protein HMPREF1052_0774 [Pasteurella bettyae CCUG 2042]SUB21184.1 Uncharacterized BCR, YitT family COG1284 [Pasteurella bettyae]
MSKMFSLLPQTRWTATSFWSLEAKSLGVLVFSLAIMGIGEGLLLLSNLGSSPWTILAQGIALQGHFSVGWASFIISILVMLAWIPLRLKVGIGTLFNVFIIALVLGMTVSLFSAPSALIGRFTFAIVGILCFGVGSSFYLTCHQGAGPRDGLMVGLCQHFHLRIGIVRTILEVSACILGFILGGTVGIGTLLFAFLIGWIVQFTVSMINRSPCLLSKIEGPTI